MHLEEIEKMKDEMEKKRQAQIPEVRSEMKVVIE